MARRSRILFAFALVFLISIATGNCFAQGALKSNRELLSGIAQGVHDIIQKNFYDPSLKGVNWDKELQEAERKIDAGNNPSEMLAAVYWMIREIDDSHTNFLPPPRTLEPRFGFQAKPFGDTVRVYRVREKGPADKAGLRVGNTVLAIEGVAANRKTYLETQFYYRLIVPAAVLVLDIDRNGQRQRLEIPSEVHTRQAMEMVCDFSKVYDAIRGDKTAGAVAGAHLQAEDRLRSGSFPWSDDDDRTRRLPRRERP